MLLLDEPTAGMSIRETDEIVALLKRLCGGMTVVVIEHDMSFVRQIADRVAVFSNGRLVEAGETEAVFTRPSHEYTNCLIAAAAMSWQAER